MKSISVKAKILISIITLTVVTILVFAHFALETYVKDKLALVYSSLSSETQAKSQLFVSTTHSFDFLLSSIISGTDLKSRHLSLAHLKFVKNTKAIQGLYISGNENGEKDQFILYESSAEEPSWDVIENVPMGISVFDLKRNTFFLKKPLADQQSFALLVFQSKELADIFKNTENEFNFILNLPTLSPIKEQESFAKVIIDTKLPSTPSGLIPITHQGSEYFLSFARLNFQNLVLINLLNKDKVFRFRDYFFAQLVFFCLLIISISLLLGTLGARWLTWHIDQLTSVAEEMGQENFEARVSFNSDDELGVLGSSFNTMGEKISNLLGELKRYNAELEKRVEERTQELKELTDIQKGMLDSLGQGFVLINKEHNILPIYSKIAEEMFEKTPTTLTPAQIMGVKTEEEQNYKELCDLVFNKILGVDDALKLFPDTRKNNKNQFIQLNYAPIHDSVRNELEYLLIIGTDKTAENEAMEKFKKEWNFSQMILKLASNRFSANKIIADALAMLSTAQRSLRQNKTYSLRETQRLVHTIKGSFAFFNAEEIKNQAHEIETSLSPYYDSETCPEDLQALLLTKLANLENTIAQFIDNYDQILQYKTAQETKTISLTLMNQYLQLLQQKDPQLAHIFKSHFYKTKIAPYFQFYPTAVKELCLKLNKEVRFIIEGGEIELPDAHWDELFGQFIHIVRNSLDHGFEPPFVRQEKGKPREGTLRFSFQQNGKELQITIQDDGQGIQWEKLAAKDPRITNLAEAIEKIMTGGLSSRTEVSDLSGRGVGVSSVYSCVQRWKGYMSIQSEPEVGTTYSILIPLNFNKDTITPSRIDSL